MQPKKIKTEPKGPERYTTIEQISEGAFGQVYKALDNQKNHHVAIKQVYRKDERDKTCHVNRQIAIMKRLNNPNIVKLLDIEQKGIRTNIVMEHCEHDLSQLISSLEYPADPTIIKIVFRQILQAVAYLHKMRIIHRDIKPSNILLTENLSVKLGDFGSAVDMQEKVTKGQFDIEGFTKWYKAPEILFGDRMYNTDIDIWSLGCLFAELVDGVPLFCGGSQIEQLVKISDLLGSADPQNWPGIVKMPDYGKIIFLSKPPKDFDKYFDNWQKPELDLLKCMLRYEGRLSAENLLKHPYFDNFDPNTRLSTAIHWRKRNEHDQYFNYQRLLKQ